MDSVDRFQGAWGMRMTRVAPQIAGKAATALQIEILNSSDHPWHGEFGRSLLGGPRHGLAKFRIEHQLLQGARHSLRIVMRHDDAVYARQNAFQRAPDRCTYNRKARMDRF